MKKSFDPQNLNYVPSEKAYYQEQLNTCKDNIFFSSVEELAQLIVDLKALKTALESDIAIVTTPNTLELHNEYSTAAEYFHPEYYEDACAQIFRTMVLSTIEEFTAELEAETPEQKQARVNERVKRHDDEVLRVKQNAELLNKRFVSDEILISHAESEMYEKFCITTKKKAACELCLSTSKVLAQIEHLTELNNREETERLSPALVEMKITYSTREFNNIREKFLSILVHGLKIQRPGDDEIAEYSLETMKINLMNIFLMFHSSAITIKEFQRNYDARMQKYLLEDSLPLLSIVLNASEDEHRLFMDYSLQRWDLSKAELFGEDVAIEITRLDCRISALKDVIIPHQIPTAEFEAWDDEFVQALAERGDNIKALAACFALENSKMSVEQIANDELIAIHQIFRFSKQNVIDLLDKADMYFSNIIERTTVKYKDILSMSDERLAIWLSTTDNVYTVARARTLMNYFFMPKEMILQAEPELFYAIFSDPQYAIAVFNKDAHYVAAEALAECLSQASKTLFSYFDAFKDNGYMVNITKISAFPTFLVRELQKIGLDFQQCRAIYDLFVLKNYGFTTNYVKSIGELDFDKYKFNYGMAIGVRFDAAQAEVIRGILDPYVEALETVLNSRTSGLPEKFGYLAEILSQPEDELDIAALCTALENRVKVSSLTQGNVTAKHLQLYQHLLASNAAKYCKTDGHFANLINVLNEVFSEHADFPKNDMGLNSNKDAGPLFKAIFCHIPEEITELLNSGTLPIGRNFKGASYLACAALDVLDDVANIDVYHMIKKKIEQCTQKKLYIFLFGNKIANKSNAYQLAFAITRGDDYIVQALLARDADLYSKLKDFDNQTPLELAAKLTGASRECILSDLLTMQELHQFLKLEDAKQAVITQAPKQAFGT